MRQPLRPIPPLNHLRWLLFLIRSISCRSRLAFLPATARCNRGFQTSHPMARYILEWQRITICREMIALIPPMVLSTLPISHTDVSPFAAWHKLHETTKSITSKKDRPALLGTAPLALSLHAKTRKRTPNRVPLFSPSLR